ncbi:MAG TPA: heat-inducible transcriptional repressor HrcA [Clostridia bacterium]|nr:heat-inducible transcriptional repressor HrcA [Clostridia bacterium]
MELDQRKLSILRAIIDEYIMSANPVGSKALSQRGDLGWSSATIRNEMSELEDLGYLEQPHTSAGRIPSDKAYRLYVDSMMQRAKLTPNEISFMQSYCSRKVSGVESVMRETARALSKLTKLPAFALLPQLSASRIQHVQLVPLSDGRALLVLVNKAGVAKNMVVRVPRGVSSSELAAMSEMITDCVKDCPMNKVCERLLCGMGDVLSDRREYLTGILDAISSGTNIDAHLVELVGATSMLQYPEYSDVDKARSFLAKVEEKDAFYELLNKASEMEFTISIGGENTTDGLQDCSIVTASYKIGGTPVGSFGVIGPTRMDYGKVVSVLDYMRLSLGDILMSMIKEE